MTKPTIISLTVLAAITASHIGCSHRNCDNHLWTDEQLRGVIMDKQCCDFVPVQRGTNWAVHTFSGRGVQPK